MQGASTCFRVFASPQNFSKERLCFETFVIGCQTESLSLSRSLFALFSKSTYHATTVLCVKKGSKVVSSWLLAFLSFFPLCSLLTLCSLSSVAHFFLFQILSSSMSLFIYLSLFLLIFCFQFLIGDGQVSL